MRKLLLSLLSAALVLGALVPLAAWAEAPKPVAVVSLPSYDEVLADIGYVGTLADNPDLPKAVEGLITLVTQGRGLAGVDKARPAGVVVYLEGDKPAGFGFLPVTDAEKLHDSLKPLIKDVTDVGDGVYKVEGYHGRPGFVKERNGWLFVSGKAEMLANLPDDPSQALAGLNQQYDAAVRLSFGNLTAGQREKLLAAMKKQADKHLERRWFEEEKDFAIRQMLAKRVQRQVATSVKELDQVTIGWSLDRNAQKAYLDVTAVAAEGTDMAREMAALGQTKSKFAGFQLPGAVLSGDMSCSFPPIKPEQLAVFFDKVRERAFEQIDAHVKHESHAQTVKQLLGGLLDVTRETLATAHVDVGMAVVLRPDAATLAVGKYIADSNKLEKTLGDFVEAVRQEHPDFVAKVLKEDAEQYKGVRMHVLTLPIPERAPEREKAVQLVGETLEVVVGFGDQSFYLAAGRDALKTLKQAIDASESKAAQTVPPAEFIVTLSELARFGAAMGDGREKDHAEKAAALLQQAGSLDHVRLVAQPIERGVKWRLELEQGVLKLIANAHKTR